MSNDIPPSENVNQAESSIRSNPEMTESPLLMKNIEEIDFDSLSDEEIIKYMNDLANNAETHFSLNNEEGVELLLATEKAGFKPKESEKHFLKKKFPDIDFKTPDWQTWWRNMKPFNDKEEEMAWVTKSLEEYFGKRE